jgi:hypothetical protein
MRVETPYFAFALPDGYVERPGPDGGFNAVHEVDAREIVVTSVMMGEEADVDAVFRRLANIRLGVFRDRGAAEQALPLAFADRGDLRTASFLCVGKDPTVSFCGMVTHRRAVIGQYCLVTVCIYQYAKRDGAPDVESFHAAGRALLATLEPLPQRAALERGQKQGKSIDPSRVYPYLVPAAYLENRKSDAPMPRALGHGVYLAFAEDFDGAARIHFPEDVASLGEPQTVIELARRNLARAAGEQKVTIRGFDGPRKLPVMVFGREWLAASCLLLPNLHAFAARFLGDGPMCASIPHRDAMLVFRQGDAAYRDEMRAFIAANEADGRKPLTSGLFAIGPDKIEPLDVS